MNYFPYFYSITIDRVIDGDTVEAVFDLGFHVSLKVTVRMAGYDAPETFRPYNEAEKVAGEHAKVHLMHLLLNTYGQYGLYCRSTKIDLYGRSTGIIYCKTGGIYVSINDVMAAWIIENHYTKAELRA